MTALRPEDADAIAQETGLAAAAAPAVHRSLIARWQDRSSSVAVTGTTTVGLDIRGIRASRGRLFDDDEDRERRRVAVLGPTVARNFFDAASPVGREIRIGTIPFEVVGVASPRGIDIAGSDLDNEVVIPLQTAMRRLLNVPYVNAIVVQATKSERLDDLEEDVQAILSRRHPARAGAGDAAPYVIQNQAELLRTERGATQAFNRMITSTAALALLVGGVGIVAVMLLSIRERTREIGLRRALGARRRDIQIQFLLESALLAVTGGVCGIVVGLFVAAVAAAFGRWELAFPWLAALAAIATSVALGLSMGVLPASHAGRLEPSVALRSG
jgi:putative ABC transport system permease protein